MKSNPLLSVIRMKGILLDFDIVMHWQTDLFQYVSMFQWTTIVYGCTSIGVPDCVVLSFSVATIPTSVLLSRPYQVSDRCTRISFCKHAVQNNHCTLVLLLELQRIAQLKNTNTSGVCFEFLLRLTGQLNGLQSYVINVSLLLYNEKMKLIVAIVGMNEITVLIILHRTDNVLQYQLAFNETDVDYLTSMCTVGVQGLAGRGEKRKK